MNGIIYQVNGFESAFWLPLGQLLGIALQVFACFANKKLPLFAGMAVVCICAALERDITLAVGDVLATSGMWWCMKEK